MSYLKKTLQTSVCALAALSVSATSYSKVSPTADLMERENTLRRATSVSAVESRVFTRLSGRIDFQEDSSLGMSGSTPALDYPQVLLVQGSETRSDEPTSLFKQFRSYPLVDRALRLMDRGALDEAREFLDRAFEQDPNNPRIWHVSALLELRRENPQIAEEHASRALELDETSAIAKLYRGMARSELENAEGAKSDLVAALNSKGLTRTEKKLAEDSLESLGFDPAGTEIMVAEAETTEVTPSEEPVEEPVEQPIDETPAEAPETLEELTARVDDLENSGAYEDALAALKERDDLDDVLTMRRARNAFRTGKADDALKDLKRLNDENVDQSVRIDAARLTAQIESQKGNDKKAIAALDIVEQLDSLSKDEKLAYVDHALEEGKDDQAIRHLTDLFEGASGAERVELGLRLSDLHKKVGYPALALSTLEKIADDETVANEERVKAWDAIAGLAAEQNDTDTVVRAYNKAFELSGDESYQSKVASAQPEGTPAESTEVAEVDEPEVSEPEVAEAPELPTQPTEEEVAAAQAAAEEAERKELADQLEAAEALAIDGKTRAAISAFTDLAKSEETLDASQRERLYRSLAQLNEQQENYAAASANWKKVYGIDRRVETAIEIARTARLAEEYAEARTFLNLIVADRLSPELKALYYDEVSLSFERDSVSAALDPARKAVFAKEAAFRRVRVADLLSELDRHQEAILELQQALILEPNNPMVQRMLGYAYIAADEPAKARAAFEKAVELDPADKSASEELARLTAEAETEVAEVETKPEPVFAEPEVAAVKPPLKLEIEESVKTEPQETTLADTPSKTAEVVEADEVKDPSTSKSYKERFFFDTEFVYRQGDNPSPATLPEAGPSQSYVFAKGGIFLPMPSNWSGMRVALTGRIFGAFEERSLDYDGDTTQAGVGVRFMPFRKHELVLDVERLIEIGDDSRDAWFLTASYNWEHGGSFRDQDLNWNFTAFEGEVAYIPNEPEVATAFAEILQGRMFAFADSFAVYPHGIFSVQFADDDNDSDTLVEMGPGVGFRYWFEEPEGYRPTTMDVRLQYRFSLADNREGGHEGGLVGTVKFEY